MIARKALIFGSVKARLFDKGYVNDRDDLCKYYFPYSAHTACIGNTIIPYCFVTTVRGGHLIQTVMYDMFFPFLA